MEKESSVRPAGMSRVSATGTRCRCSLPRTRGDEPMVLTATDDEAMSAPHTRG